MQCGNDKLHTHLQSQHSCAVRCGNTRPSACCPAHVPSFPGRNLPSADAGSENCTGFLQIHQYQHSQNERHPRKHRQKKCVTTVNCSAQPSNRLQWPCLKFDVFLQEKLTCCCSTRASSHYCSYTVSSSGCLLRPENSFPLGGRKACPMLGKAVQLPVKLTLKC